MEIPSLQPSIRASDLPIEKLAGNSNVAESDKIAEVSRQFEAVLLRQILAKAQKPVFPSPWMSQSVSAGIYQDMVVGQLADAISQSGTIGLARSLQGGLEAANGGNESSTDEDFNAGSTAEKAMP